MIKDELRAQMREKRRALTLEEIVTCSAKIKNMLFSLDCFKGADCAKNVCTYISSFKEVDTVDIVKKLREMNIGIIVPISNTDSCTLTLSKIDGMEDLQKGAYGILEPREIRTAEESEIDVILVPGLAFDKRGGRMGFGKGYYDRLLAKTTAVKIGLCYDFQLFDKIPTESHDVPLDYVITEKEIYETGD